jgi:hypothetical protein
VGETRTSFLVFAGNRDFARSRALGTSELWDFRGVVSNMKPKDKKKLFALHAPEVECLAKGKIRMPYEFGVKVSITTTGRSG